ncbi:MAG: glycosyltransferase [Fodinibius sp.]|nr:glycosyltransferase [Fodinibius sp.]
MSLLDQGYFIMTTNENPTITFIICTYNRGDYLDRALNSLQEQKVDTDQAYEILVVDNNSSDHTADIFKKHQSANPKDRNPIRYVKETNQGLTYARNRGIREARAPYVVFLDDDICASENLVSAWLTFFNTHPDATAGGGRIHVRFDAERPESDVPLSVALGRPPRSRKICKKVSIPQISFWRKYGIQKFDF